MRIFNCLLFVLNRSFVCYYIICMTVFTSFFFFLYSVLLSPDIIIAMVYTLVTFESMVSKFLMHSSFPLSSRSVCTPTRKLLPFFFPRLTIRRCSIVSSNFLRSYWSLCFIGSFIQFSASSVFNRGFHSYILQ